MITTRIGRDQHLFTKQMVRRNIPHDREVPAEDASSFFLTKTQNGDFLCVDVVLFNKLYQL